MSKKNRRKKKSDESLSSKTSNKTFSAFRKNKSADTRSDIDYQSDTQYNYSNNQFNRSTTPNNRQVPQSLSFGHRTYSDVESNDSKDFFDLDPSQSRDSSLRSYEMPVVDKSDSERSSGFFHRRNRTRRKNRKGNRTSLNQNDHLQIDNYNSSHSGSSWGESMSFSGSSDDELYSESEEEFSLNMSGHNPRQGTHGQAVDYSQLNKHKKDLASQNLQAIESMARKEGPNHADEAFQIFPNHAYPNTKMTRKQLRKHMNARSAFFHDLRMPRLSGGSKELGKLRLEVLQCFGLPTTSLVKEVSAYAVAVMGSCAFQTDIIPNVANPMWLSKMRRACLFPVEQMYSQLSIGIFDLEAAYAHPDTVIGHDGHPGWRPPEERTGFGFHRSNSMASTGRGSVARQSMNSFGGFDGARRSSMSLGDRRSSANLAMTNSLKNILADDDDDDVPGKLPSETGQPPAEFCTKAEDFIGHVVVDICRLRPGSTYDVTLPLRRSNHVFTREPQGSVRIRLHLEWSSERAAVMSYLPKSLGGTVNWERQPNTRYTVNCVDDRAARNVAHAVHGIHMPGKFDMALLKSTIREMHWTRIHLLRYCKNREIYHLTYWVNPSISGFVFLAWMHAVYFNTVRYVPGHVVVFFLLHLIKNYAYYAMDSPLQNGFLVPSLEEIYYALMRGTRKRKKPCIQPLTVEREAEPMALTSSDHHGGMHNSLSSMDELYDENGNLVHVTRYPLSEIADAMKKSLTVKPYRKGLTVFKHTFQGEDAVDFLLRKGFAMTRAEAVAVGRRLEREKKLFQHISKDSNFEDSNLIFTFLDTSGSDRFLQQKSHVPMGGKVLELLGFYKSRKNQTKAGGVDILESREHVEFPFATGVDHPRFTVKESLVIRSAEERTRLKREDEATAMVEAADFGIVLSSRNLFATQQQSRPSLHAGYESEGGLDRRKLLQQSHGSADGRMPRRGSAIGNAITTGATVVTEGAKTMMQRRSSGTGRNSFGSGQQLLEVATSSRDMYSKLKAQNSTTINKVLELQRKADQYDPYEYDSDGDVKTILKKKRKKNIILEKHLKKPMSQEIGNIGTATEVDLSLAKSLEKTKRHVNAFFYHMFSDQVYKIDKSVFPTTMEKKRDNDDKKKKKKKGIFNRRMSIEEMEEEEEQQRRLQMTPYELQQEEMEKTLLINQFSHWNPWMNRIAVIMQPLLEMAQTFIFFFRALFNLLTWQDPVLCFWLCFTGPPLAVILYVCPYRIVFLFLGIYLVGPQNFLIRIYRESKDGYEPPNFDMVVKTKKIEKKKKDELRQLQFFSSEAPGNQQIRFRNIDPTQVKQIVVPSNVMLYRNRFYDWPPEPKYCRVYASEAPSNLLVPGYAEDKNGYGYDSDSTYVFDQAARRREEEERRKVMLKKKRARKKGVGRKFTDGIVNATQMGIGVVETAGGAVLHGTEQVLGVTADVTVGAVKGTANLTKTVVKGTRRGTISAVKGTGNLLRLRKKNKYKNSPYSDDEDEYYY